MWQSGKDRASHGREKRPADPPKIAPPNRGSLARASGLPVAVEVEHGDDPERIDHVWIDIDCGSVGIVRGSVNTFSRRSELAGFDPRVRVGISRSIWVTLPDVGVFPSPGLDYAAIESRTNVFYETPGKVAIEKMLVEKAESAVRIEIWGELYARKKMGLHQIHSRHASCAVPEDKVGSDGALKFFFEADPDRFAELLLFKFCGQP